MVYYKVLAFEPTSITKKRIDFFYLQDNLELNRGDGFAFVILNEDGVFVTTVRLNGVSFASLKQIEFVALNKLVSCNDRQKGYHIMIHYEFIRTIRYKNFDFYSISERKMRHRGKNVSRTDGICSRHPRNNVKYFIHKEFIENLTEDYRNMNKLIYQNLYKLDII